MHQNNKASINMADILNDNGKFSWLIRQTDRQACDRAQHLSGRCPRHNLCPTETETIRAAHFCNLRLLSRFKMKGENWLYNSLGYTYHIVFHTLWWWLLLNNKRWFPHRNQHGSPTHRHYSGPTPVYLWQLKFVLICLSIRPPCRCHLGVSTVSS